MMYDGSVGESDGDWGGDALVVGVCVCVHARARALVLVLMLCVSRARARARARECVRVCCVHDPGGPWWW